MEGVPAGTPRVSLGRNEARSPIGHRRRGRARRGQDAADPMTRLRRALVLLVLILPAIASAAEAPPAILPLREQHRIRQEWLKARLERVLPSLMRRHGASMWIVANREYNEDPVFLSLVSPSVFAARRRTI